MEDLVELHNQLRLLSTLTWDHTDPLLHLHPPAPAREAQVQSLHHPPVSPDLKLFFICTGSLLGSGMSMPLQVPSQSADIASNYWPRLQ